MKKCALVCLMGLSVAASAQFNVQPYLQDAEPNSVRVMWESEGLGEAVLEWGPDSELGNVLSSTGSPSSGGAMHDVIDPNEKSNARENAVEHRVFLLVVADPHRPNVIWVNRMAQS